MGYLLRGVLIGLLFGLPVGAVGAMTVQRAWRFGWKAGLLTGLGASAADCLYALVGAFGLTLVSDFLLQHQTVINALGGGLILCMGAALVFKKEDAAASPLKAAGGTKMFLAAFAVGITNPAAILTFLFAFSFFGIAAVSRPLDGVLLVGGVFAGTCIWWMALSAATCALKKRTGQRGFRHRNQVFGAVLLLFGAVVLCRTFV